MRAALSLILLLTFQYGSFAQPAHSGKRLNIIVSTKAPKPDPALMSFHSQTWLTRQFHRRKMKFIIANTFEEAIQRVTGILKKENAMVGNLWFDSHGHMGRRISLLEIGDVEINVHTIKEQWIRDSLSSIGRYCDSLSNVSLGSCYSAAAYNSAGIDSFPVRPMDGDSLMVAFGNLMNHARLYGSVSWVMTRLGIYGNGYALAGHPGSKRFKDSRFKAAWDSLGIWRTYTPTEGLRFINTVALDGVGNIRVKDKPYLERGHKKKQQERLIKKLRQGNFADKYFFQYRDPLHIRNGREKSRM